MSKKVIRFSLDTTDINRAIRELNEFKRDFRKKVDTYRKRIADEIAVKASLNFGSAIVDDAISGGSSRSPDVQVNVTERGSISVIVADGEDAVWCEFGSGVYRNGSVGGSPHPYGSDLGFTIGSYGEGKGKQQVWGYYTDPENKTGLVLTRGTPASMPMYNAAQEVLHKSVEIAREVFG